MQTIEKIARSEIEVNRSKFIAFLIPYGSFETYYRQLKEEYPKANHIVYAYRFLNDNEQIVENSSDDGEPKGCAGVPVLNVMRGGRLTDCAVAVVRYFGGIKLGTGGMARAYADAAKAVVQAADVVAFILRRRYRFKTGYEAVRQTEYRLQRYGIEVVQRDFVADGVIWQVLLSEEEKNKLQGHYALQEVED